MAISQGTVITATGYPQNLITSGTHTINSGSNRMVVLFIGLLGADAYTLSNVQYGVSGSRVTMTSFASQSSGSLFSRSCQVFAYYLLESSLPTGGSTCSFTFQSNAGYASIAYAIDLSNVAQTSNPYNSAGNGSTSNPGFTGAFGTATSINVDTTSPSQLLLDMGAVEESSGAPTFTPAGSQTALTSVLNGTGQLYGEGSYLTAGGNPNTMNWTPSGTYTHWAELVLSINEFGSAALDNAAIMGATF